ncbi:MAG: glycosyltransferase family 4 protein, partial [Vicinamibacteria bacterium]
AVRSLAAKDCQFLPSCRDLSKSAVAKIDLPTDKPVFLFLGRWHRNKGIDVLLDALRSLSPFERKRFRMLVFGGGPLEPEIERARRDPALSETLVVGGFVDETTAAGLITVCDAVVIPSRVESIPVVLSDALLLGRPVVSADVGDMGPLVRKHKCGIVVPPGDPRALGRALVELCEGGTGPYRPGIASLSKLFSVDSAVSSFLRALAGPGGEETGGARNRRGEP